MDDPPRKRPRHEMTAAEWTTAVRVQAHKALDRLFRVVTAPGYTGHLGLEIHAKDGRPMLPVTNVTQIGVDELE